MRDGRTLRCTCFQNKRMHSVHWPVIIILISLLAENLQCCTWIGCNINGQVSTCLCGIAFNVDANAGGCYCCWCTSCCSIRDRYKPVYNCTQQHRALHAYRRHHDHNIEFQIYAIFYNYCCWCMHTTMQNGHWPHAHLHSHIILDSWTNRTYLVTPYHYHQTIGDIYAMANAN